MSKTCDAKGCHYFRMKHLLDCENKNPNHRFCTQTAAEKLREIAPEVQNKRDREINHLISTSYSTDANFE